MSIEVDFVGGPRDGSRTRIDGDPLNPPEVLSVADDPQPIDPPQRDGAGDKFAYWRTTHADHVWRYLYGKPA